MCAWCAPGVRLVPPRPRAAARKKIGVPRHHQNPPDSAFPGRCQPPEFQRRFGEKLTLMRPESNSEPFHPGNTSRVLGSSRGSTPEDREFKRKSRWPAWGAGSSDESRDGPSGGPGVRTKVEMAAWGGREFARKSTCATRREFQRKSTCATRREFQRKSTCSTLPGPRRSTCPGHPGPVPTAGVPTSVRRKGNADASRIQF